MTMFDVLGQVKLPVLDCLSFAALSGSYAYGTQREGSDLDVRGFFMGDPRSLLLQQEIKPVRLEEQDMTFWPFHEFLWFLVSGRPAALELLFTRERDRFCFNKFGRTVLENREMFLSRRAIAAFHGYIDRTYGDLMRMLSKDCQSEQEHDRLRLEMLEGAADSLKRRFPDGACGLSLSEDGILCDLSLQQYPLRKFRDDLSCIQEMLRGYDAASRKETKVSRTAAQINKTACHCVRLMAELTELAGTGSFSVCRVGKPEYKLLRSILAGQYQDEDGSFDRDAFIELVSMMREDMRYAVEHTCLPADVDHERIRELELDLVSEYVRNYLA